jgi:hypothetical protein
MGESYLALNLVLKKRDALNQSLIQIIESQIKEIKDGFTAAGQKLV